MVLDKLGSALKGTLKKIAKAVFVDESLVNELVKDIQRALLYSDVNVKLVFDLTRKIKQRALKEKVPKKVAQKEHLINIVYEELVNFLGEEKKGIKIEKKKPFKIMMIGLFGSGKCVHAKSKIPLNNGEILEAKDIYKKFSDLPKEYLDDGEVIDISNENLFVPSFNPKTLKIENKRATHLWKLDGKDLIKINLDNGNDFSVKVTLEHPFFVLREGNLIQIRADELNEDDFVAVSRNYGTQSEIVDLFDDLKKLNLDIYLDKEEKKKLLKGKILKDLCKNLKFKRNYCKLTSNIKRGRVPFELINNFNNPILNIKLKNSNKAIYLPRYVTSELAEFLGYVIGDGHLDKKYVEVFSENTEIIKRISGLSYSLFGLNAKIEKDKRSKKLFRIRIVSKTLVYIFNKIFNINIGKKGRNLSVPKQIMQSSSEVVSNFIRAYFDCDSYVNKNAREIELCSESKDLVDQISLLLLRFNIISSKSSKKINDLFYYRLFIRARYAEIYNDKIGFIVKHKLERASKFKLIGIRQGCGKQDMIPLARNLKSLRENLGFSIGQLQKNGVNSYGRYEQFGMISRESLLKTICLYCEKEGNIVNTLLNLDNIDNVYNQPFVNSLVSHLIRLGLITKQNNTLSLTNDGQLLISKIGFINKNKLLKFSKNLSESDVCWLRVKKTNKIDNDSNYVYDLTVEDNHSFIADGIIVHNTTTIGKLANYYSKRGYKVAALGLDVHRPAAIDQIEQICEKAKIKCFTKRKEKNVLKIYNEFKTEYSKYDILIIDTAGRDALSKDLIKEIKDLNDNIKPNEKLLVISGDIGQAAQKQAEVFHENCKITGVVVTKLDGTAKGGGALSACSITKAPVKFIGVGEKLNDLEEFNPKGFVGRLLGMGDLEALLEKAKEAISEEDAKDLGKRMLKGEFNFLDLFDQMKAMRKMGPLAKMIDLIPGLGGFNIPKDMLNVQQEKLDKWKHILQSMTRKELENPELIDANRIDRIAKGAGVKTSEVRELLKQYRQTKKVLKMMKGSGDPKDLKKMLKKFKGKLPKGFKI